VTAKPSYEELEKRVQKLEKEMLIRTWAEEALRESEERYRSLVETMYDGLLVRDENDTITYVNERLCQIWGYSPDEVIGHQLRDFLDEENWIILKDQLAKRRKGAHDSYEIAWRGKNGQKVFTIMSPKPVFGAHGHFRGSFVVITDITNRKQGEEALARQAAELARSNAELQASLSEIILRLKDIISNRTFLANLEVRNNGPKLG